MKLKKITTAADLEWAKKRIDRIEDEVMDLEEEIGDLKGEQELLENEIERFEKLSAYETESLAKKLWEHVQRSWNRFTWLEQRITEGAAQGEKLTGDEHRRWKLLLMQELHICEGGAK